MKDQTAPAHWRAFVSLVARLPQAAISRCAGWLADRRLPVFMRRPVFSLFSKAVGLDLAEVELPLGDYPTLNAFFVRRLKPGLRPMPDDPKVVVSPVDGEIAEIGPIDGERLLQVKGIHYTVADLLDDHEMASSFAGGDFVTIYLRPMDYHRIHAPCDGSLDWARHVPGTVFPVNPPSVALVPDLFVRNERLMCSIGPAGDRIAVVAVAALNVARISSEFDREWNGPRGGVTNRRGTSPMTRRYDPPIDLLRGDELMVFHLGSTIVLLLDATVGALRRDLRPGDRICVGQSLTEPLVSASRR